MWEQTYYPVPVMQRARFSVLCLALLACGSAPQGGGAVDSTVAQVATDDGLALRFDRNTGAFQSLSVSSWQLVAKGGAPGSAGGATAPSSPAAVDAPAGAVGIALADHTGAVLLDATGPVSEVRYQPGQVQRVRRAESHGLQVVESWSAHPHHLELQATIAVMDASGADGATTEAGEKRSRAVEACLTVPIDAVGKTWHHHLHESETIEDGRRYQTLLTSALDIGHHAKDGISSHLKSRLPFNLHGINAITDERAGLAIAMHPESPAAYFVAYDGAARELRACFHLGIYRGHQSEPDRTDLRLALFAIDEPSWGLRSALREYTETFARWFRSPGDRRTGMTVGGGYRHELYPVPDEFHITSMWNGYRLRNRRAGVQNLLYAWPTGYLERGMRLRARPVSGPCAECDRSIDAHIGACLALYRDYEQGAVRFPETCGWLFGDSCQASAVLPTEERTYGPVRIRRNFYDLLPQQVIGPSHRALRLLGKFALHEPLTNSLLETAGGRHDGALSDSHSIVPAGRSKQFYTCYINGLNPDPGVAVAAGYARERAGEAKSSRQPVIAPDNFGHLNLEIARRATGVYGEGYTDRAADGASRIFDGVALDTVGAYLRPDFHEEMLAVASHPLAYDPDTGRIVAMEHLGLTAFISELRRSVPEGTTIASNGYPISGTLGQDVDVFVRELGRRWRQQEDDDKPRYYYELYEDEVTRLRRVNRLRMVANQRPITFWARFLHTEKHAVERGVDVERALLDDMRRWLPLYTAKGVYTYIQRTGMPGRDRFFGYEMSRPLVAEYQRHLDAVHALTVAGWQAIPYARASDPAITIERFGAAGGRVLFTLYNTSAQPVTTSIAWQWRKLGRERAPRSVRDFATGESLPLATDAGAPGYDLRVTVPAHQVRILVAAQ